jgi:hypothetical protein
VREYSLVLTDQRHGPDAKGKVAIVDSEWKIKDFEPDSMVTVDAAIRYLQGLRNKTDRDDVKKNAERAIAELTTLRNEWRK